MKKNLKILLTMAVVVFAMAFVVQLKAAELGNALNKNAGVKPAVSSQMKYSKEKFGIYDYLSSSKKIKFGMYCEDGANTVQFELYKNNKKIKSYSFDATTYYYQYTDYIGISSNVVYKYRVKSDISEWSDYKYFVSAKVKYSVRSNQKGFKLKTPKIKGVKKYKVYIAKSYDGTYKKAKAIKGNKKRTTRITKKYKKRAYNYVKIVPVIKGGGKNHDSEIITQGSLYVYK